MCARASMERFLLIFYTLFFATGFMGATALILLDLRVRSRLLRPLLLFQGLFLLATGLIVVYFYLLESPGDLSPDAEAVLIGCITVLSAAVWAIVVVLVRRIAPPETRRRGYPAAAEILAGLAGLRMLSNIAVMALDAAGRPLFTSAAALQAWDLGGMILYGLAMAAFGIMIRFAPPRGEPAALHPLLRAYGLVAILFAPVGVVEHVVELAGIPGLAYISLDHFFFFTWNLVSMSAAYRVFRPLESGVPAIDAVPAERVRALGLSAREAEMAVMIGRGLANKEIAAELNISPATVRTHIYNLYQKVGARSRVELLNKLRA
jgi:DNA-binding CsgD family transcriptional regulator